jgi:hypothetical protein
MARTGFLCYYAFMRTTIDLPDPVFKRLKATAALKGVSLKGIILAAVEKELQPGGLKKKRTKFPLIRSKEPGTLSLTNADIDEILLG